MSDDDYVLLTFQDNHRTYRFFANGTYRCDHWENVSNSHWRIVNNEMMYRHNYNSQDWHMFPLLYANLCQELETELAIYNMLNKDD